MVTVDPKDDVTVKEDEKKDVYAVWCEPHPLPPRHWVRDPVITLFEALLAQSLETGKFATAIGAT
jgi:hypothetical protein